MAKFQNILINVAIHCSLIVAGLIVSFLIISLFNRAETAATKPIGTDVEKFYLLLSEYAYQLDGKGFDSGFTYGMSETSRQRFENLLNAIRYRENCTQRKSWTVDGVNSCLVDGQVIDYIQFSRAD